MKRYKVYFEGHRIVEAESIEDARENGLYLDDQYEENEVTDVVEFNDDTDMFFDI